MRSRHTPLSLLIWLTLTLMLTACGSGVSTPKESYAVAESKLSRDTAPAVDEGSLRRLAEANNAFALSLLRASAQHSDRNILFSPYSISEILAICYAGAAGETKREMAEALHFRLPDEKLHAAFDALDLHLNYRDANYTLDTANALWAQKGFSFSQPYLDRIKKNYGANIKLLDFTDGEASRRIINRWIEAKTRQKIKNLIPPRTLSASTRLLLTNTLYFQAQWERPFAERNTQTDLFYTEADKTVEVPFMMRTDSYRYAETEACQAVEIPYLDRRSSMVILLPKESGYDDLLSQIDTLYPEVISAMHAATVTLRMPKFSYTATLSGLKQYLQQAGMQRAFAPDLADFSGMSDSAALYISDIMHKAYIDLDEKGTEAAAATAVILSVTGLPSEVKEMKIDRPFLCFIRDLKSGQILFAGAVKIPEQRRE